MEEKKKPQRYDCEGLLRLQAHGRTGQQLTTCMIRNDRIMGMNWSPMRTQDEGNVLD